MSRLYFYSERPDQVRTRSPPELGCNSSEQGKSTILGWPKIWRPLVAQALLPVRFYSTYIGCTAKNACATRLFPQLVKPAPLMRVRISSKESRLEVRRQCVIPYIT